jgi:hypothetical protein
MEIITPKGIQLRTFAIQIKTLPSNVSMAAIRLATHQNIHL